MNVIVTGRQFDITPAIREKAEGRIQPMVDDASLKPTSAKFVLERVKNSFKANFVFSCKYHVYTASVEDFDLYRAIDAAADKVEGQLHSLKEKIRDHQAVPLCDSELKKAQEAMAEM